MFCASLWAGQIIEIDPIEIPESDAEIALFERIARQKFLGPSITLFHIGKQEAGGHRQVLFWI